MKIHVNRIPFEGLREAATYDPKALDLEREDLHVEEPIVLSAFVTKAEREMVAQVDIRCRLRLSCAKCLESFERGLETAATLSYHVAPTDVIDMTEDIRQEILLAYPMIPICREDCRGLCPACGQNLNTGTCHCTRPSQSPGSGHSISLSPDG